MTTLNREPAKIYAFPARGTYAVSNHCGELKTLAFPSPASAKAISSSSWYHEEAIRDADDKRKN